MNFQEIELFEFGRLNTPNPLPRLRVDIRGNPLFGLNVEESSVNPFARWFFVEE